MEMKLKIEYRKVSELLPYARNARTHSDEQVSQLAASIKEFGFNNPVAIDCCSDEFGQMMVVIQLTA